MVYICDKDLRHPVATRRMNEHDWKHCASSFKHGKECRFPFQRQSAEVAKVEEDDKEETKSNLWTSLEKDHEAIFSFSIRNR